MMPGLVQPIAIPLLDEPHGSRRVEGVYRAVLLPLLEQIDGIVVPQPEIVSPMEVRRQACGVPRRTGG